MRRRPFLSVLALCIAFAFAAPAAAQTQSFSAWLEGLKAEARAKGISDRTLTHAFLGVEEPLERVLELDRRQPEFRLSFWRYMNNAVTPERVETGRALLAQHRDLLRAVEREYGVQARFLVAFWGLETNYGGNFGSFPVIHALATLAYDERRSDFFRGELLHALRIIDEGHIQPSQMEGSWAGAMGHLQFMPSTFAAYSTDRDGDGRRDIWNSLPDVFASAANFLSSLGWDGSETWGLEVSLPAGFNYELVSIETNPEVTKPLNEWAALGVTAANGAPLENAATPAAVILPNGAEGPAFLVFNNYRKILNWNRSILYAVAVGHLADRLIGEPPLVAQAPTEEERVSISEIREMQSYLNRLGHNAGTPDGKVGPMTRGAIRSYQRAAGLPADAFPSRHLLSSLRRAVSQL